jgi:hypothetical protein
MLKIGFFERGVFMFKKYIFRYAPAAAIIAAMVGVYTGTNELCFISVGMAISNTFTGIVYLISEKEEKAGQLPPGGV